jgi:hypothetical protein
MNYCDDGIHCGCSDEVDRLLKIIEKREWVGLTYEEIKDVHSSEPMDDYGFARAIEAKLREKNT